MSKPKKQWPPNIGVNNGRLRYGIKVPPDVEPRLLIFLPRSNSSHTTAITALFLKTYFFQIGF